MVLEPKVEPIFHPDSYGYRPGRSALDAVGVCRQRCWRADWVIDLDIRAFFDTVPWDLVLKAVAHHTDQKWILLYVERWLKAPLQRPDWHSGAAIAGPRRVRRSRRCWRTCSCTTRSTRGWSGSSRASAFERYCDDAVVHCRSERQARHVRDAIAATGAGRAWSCIRTRPASCTARTRTGRGSDEDTKFTFLGYEFRPRLAKKQARRAVRVVPAGGQHGRDEGDGAGKSVLAPGPAQ